MEIAYENWKLIVSRNVVVKPELSDDDDGIFSTLSEADSFDDLRLLFEAAKIGTNLKQLAYVGITERASNFDHWYYIEKNARVNSEFKKFAIDKMIERAVTFEEWKIVFDDTELYYVEHENAFNKLLENANSFDQWMHILYVADDRNPESKQQVLEEMSFMAKTQRQLQIVLNNSNPGSNIREKAKTEILKLIMDTYV